MNMNFDDDNERPREPFKRGKAEEDEPCRVKPKEKVDFGINPSDVLCGRGKLSFNHGGNKRFRDLVGESVEAYNSASSRLEKATVVNGIVEKIRAAGGRFLRSDGGAWVPLNFTQCREKCGHAIRDATSSLEARKKRKLQRENARKNIADAVLFTERQPFSHSSPWDNGAEDPSPFQVNRDNMFFQHYSYGGTNQFLAEQSRSKSLDELTSHRISPATGFNPRLFKKDSLQRDMAMHTAGMWKSNESRAKQQSGSKAADKIGDDFVAYIDDVLGPLPADADKSLDILKSVTACGETSEPMRAGKMDGADERSGRIGRKVTGGLAAPTGRERLGQRLNSRWSPNVGAPRSETKGRDAASSNQHHSTNW